MKRIIVWALYCLSVVPLMAQTVITTPNPPLYYNTRYTTKQLFLQKIDTTLENFHVFNPTLNWDVPHIALSNLAQAPRPLWFQPDQNVGFRHGYHTFDRYFYTTDSVRYYNTKTPFTSAYYMNGAKEERVIKLTHSQNIGPNLNLGFDYRRLVSESFYDRNKAGIHNFNVFNWYRSENNRYNLMAAFVFNQVKAMENGGISVDDVFTNSAYQRDLKTVPINLRSAQNQINNSNLSLRQSIYFGPSFERKINDSTEKKTIKPEYDLTHTLEYKSYKVRYTDDVARSGFYENTFLDTIATNDSSRIWTLSNEWVFRNYTSKMKDSLTPSKEYSWQGGLRYQLHRWEQMGFKDFRHTLQLFGGISSNPFSEEKLKYALGGTLDLAPRYAGDFLVNGKLIYQVTERMQLEPFVQMNLQTPGYRWEKTISNHFIWENDFKKQFIAATGLQLNIPDWRLKAGIVHHWVDNYLYVNDSIQPTQLDGSLQVLRFFATKNFSWKRFYLGNMLSVQWVSKDEVVRMPTIFLKQQLYYKGSYIKKKPIHAHLGFDLTYFNNHFADDYSPAIMSFYVQNKTSLKYYPVIDVFFNLQVKRARIFLMMQHINEGLFAGGYFASPAYPMPPRAFKFGVSWQFYD